MNTPARLSLGPLLYYWPRQKTLDFYDEIARSSVDIVYLGETVCTRRHELDAEDWQKIGERLSSAGKEVVYASQVLLESDSDVRRLKKQIAAGVQMEANDMTAVKLITANSGTPFTAGMMLNLYNEDALGLMASLGAKRWVAPVELNAEQLGCLAGSVAGRMETEVFAYGRMPLAYSARCFTARHYNFHKDGCQFVCADFPEGMEMCTQDNEPFLVLNGIQTQSIKYCDLLADIPALLLLGVNVLRISPQPQHTADIIALFRQVLNEELSPDAAFLRSEQLRRESPHPAAACNGYLHNKPGLELVSHHCAGSI